MFIFRLDRVCANTEFHFAQMHDAVGLFNYHIDLIARYPFFLIGFAVPCWSHLSIISDLSISFIVLVTFVISFLRVGHVVAQAFGFQTFVLFVLPSRHTDQPCNNVGQDSVFLPFFHATMLRLSASYIFVVFFRKSKLWIFSFLAAIPLWVLFVKWK